MPDRYVNAARNIKKRRLQWLEQEFAAAGEARADEPAVNERRPSGLTEAGHGLPAVGFREGRMSKPKLAPV